jgi:hypothetical protein
MRLCIIWILSCALLLCLLFPLSSVGDAEGYLFPFGKYRGKRISEVPRGYLEWCVREKVYANRKDFIAALVSLKLLSVSSSPPPSPPPLPPRPHHLQTSQAPSESNSSGNKLAETRALAGQRVLITLDGFFGLGVLNATGNETLPMSPTAQHAGVSGRRLSMELITARHVALYGMDANDSVHAHILKFLRKLPFACFNTSARAWSVRIDDYSKTVAAIKAAGLCVTAKSAKSDCVNRPPDCMVKALVSRPPLLQNSAVQELLAVIPPHLHSSLLPFQKEAVVFAIERGGRCVLADEMGVGKTVQSIGVAGGKLLTIYYRHTN